MHPHFAIFSLAVCLVTASGGIGFSDEPDFAGQPVQPGGYFDEVGAPQETWNDSDDRLLGIFAPSDRCFTNFISPMSNPVFFEDPRTLTEAHLLFINQTLPKSLGHDDVQVYAMQLRFALTERLSIIANKDGFIVSHSPLLDDGWADVALGLKYNVIRDVENQRILSVGAVYELPVGTPRSLQGNGDGEFNVFASGGVEFWEDWHWVTNSGFRLPVDTDAENQVWYWSNHLDRRLGDTGFYVLGEVNWHHWMKSGEAFPLPIEGVDLINLGSANVAGNDIVTGALGLKYKPTDIMEMGVAWETALTDRKGLLDDRIIVDWNIRF